MAVDKGQREAALSLGVPYKPMMMDIILHQGLKNILPALVNESIALLKDSALVSTIGIADFELLSNCRSFLRTPLKSAFECISPPS